MGYLYNPNGPATVMYLAEYDRLGAQIGALCGETEFSRSCNLPLGQPICDRCLEIARQIQAPQHTGGR